jgi:hypothetical protein
VLRQLEPERLLILIPAYNEQGVIRHVVQGVREVAPSADILVIDDGSTDQTAQEAEATGAYVLQHPFNLGIGGTVQTGLKFAQQGGYGMVIRLDGDGQHDALNIPSLQNVLQSGRADVVIGSRFLSDAATMPIPLMRRLGIKVFAAIVSLITGQQATDTTSGFWGFNRRAIAVLAACMPQDYPEVESRIVLHKAGLQALELSTPMRARLTGESSINTWRSIYYAFKVLVAVLLTMLKEIPVSFR